MRIALSGLLSRSRRLLAQLFRSAPLDGHSILSLNPLRLPSAGRETLPPFCEPDDPLSRVRVPRDRSPDGRTSAVALAEPDDRRDDVNAIGRLPFSN